MVGTSHPRRSGAIRGIAGNGHDSRGRHRPRHPALLRRHSNVPPRRQAPSRREEELPPQEGISQQADPGQHGCLRALRVESLGWFVRLYGLSSPQVKQRTKGCRRGAKIDNSKRVFGTVIKRDIYWRLHISPMKGRALSIYTYQ